MKKILITLLLTFGIGAPVWSYSQYQSIAPDDPSPALASPAVLGSHQEQVYFTVNVPSRFLGGITAPNVVYSVNGENGDITIDNSLVAGSGISISDRTITNTGILTLVAGNGISVDGNKITNSGITSLSAGTGISIDGNKITNTYSFTPDYTQSGWSDNGTSITLTTTTDSVTVGELTAGAVTVDSLTTGGLSLTSDLTVSSGHSLLPSVDLGSDIGSSSYRFNNLWVANINSNSSQSFSGQTTFSYPPTDTTINQSSVLINPTTSIANGQLLGLAIAGYEKAVIDEDGDIILGYNSLTSPPTTDYPLDIYGHSGTRVAYVDTTGNGYFGANVTASSGLNFRSASEYLRFDGTNSVLNSYYPLVLSTSVGSTNPIIFKSNNSEAMRITSSGNVGIGTTSPSGKLHLNSGVGGTLSSGLVFGDGDTGIFEKYDDGLFISTNNVEVVEIWATAFLGAGSTKWSLRNVVAGATTPNIVPLHSDSDTGIGRAGTDILSLVAGGVNGLNVNGSGNVGIGTTSPSTLLHLASASAPYIRLESTAAGKTDWEVRGQSDNLFSIKDVTNDVYPLIIDSSPYNYGTFKISSGNIVLVAGNNGKVGIGTTSPTSKIHVSGAVTGKALAIFDETGDQNILTASASGTTRFVVTNGGNVGIGTTSPTSLLQITGGDIRIEKTNGGATLNFGRTGNTTYDTSIKSGDISGADLSFFVGINRKLRLGADGGLAFGSTYSATNNIGANTAIFEGNVGIGTTSPTNLLQVNLADSATSGIALLDNGTSAGGLFIKDGTNNAGIFAPTIQGNIVSSGRSLTIIGNANSGEDAGTTPISVFRSSVNGGSVAVRPLFEWQNNTTPLMTMNYLGNVGIGTTSPSQKLVIQGGNLSIDGSTSNTNGNVGNGYQFHNLYYGASNLPIASINLANNPTYTHGAGNIVFQTQVSSVSTGLLERMRIDSAGNVGVGTTSPGEKLHVIGNGKFEGTFTVAQGYSSTFTGAIAMGNNVGTDNMTFQTGDGVFSVSTATANNQIYIPTSGNVGIGTTAPGEKLEVTGNIKTSSLTTGTVYSNNGVLTNTDPSDVNLKTNILNLPDGTLDKVLGLRTVSYDWKSTGDGALGFVAQEVQQVFPELVGTNKDGSLGLYTTQFIPLLTKAIQEQQLQIDEVRLSSASAQITNEEWSGVNTLLASIQAAVEEIKQKLMAMSERFVTKESHQEKLCVGTEDDEICLDKEQVKSLLDNLPSPTPTATQSGGQATPSPMPSPSIESSAPASESGSDTPYIIQ